MLKIIKVYLELTFACNLKCKFCYVGDMQAPTNQKLHLLKGDTLGDTFDKLNLIFCEGNDYIYDVDILGGESTLNPHIVDIIKYIKGNYNIRRFTLTTNGTYVTQSLLLESKNAGITEFRVSIHGTRDIHNHIVGVQVYDRVLQTLQTFQDNSVPYTLIYVVNALNYQNIVETVEELSKERLLPQAIFFEFVEFSGYAHQHIEELNLVYSHEVVEEVNQSFAYIQRTFPKLGFVVTNFPKCVLSPEFHSSIDDDFDIGHRYEMYIPLLGRKSFFGFTFEEQKKLIKYNLQRGYKINFQKKLEQEFIPDVCDTCKYASTCYLLVRETVLYDYLQQDFLKRKHYFELNPKLAPGK